ncbi:MULTISPECIES: ImmA/IrrE family metallo-endopeptidase [unclassified Agrococcus]|uniref:ImmA/IrrE family metallo-endopeptidase n=1 Tax=unclassified Agrococcus TaxID=2615065 RepID=UPI00360ABF3A
MRHLDDPDVLAVTNTVNGTISYAWGLTHSEQRSVIAHELGHAYYGHDCTTERAEREADRWAADLLVDPEHYALLEREGADLHAIAESLDVTEDVVDAFRAHCLQRLGRRTYGTRIRGRLTNRLARRLA